MDLRSDEESVEEDMTVEEGGRGLIESWGD